MTTAHGADETATEPVDPDPRPVGVSVLIPVLDEERYLPTVVPAMLAQTIGERFELLFIDGGSSDRSVAILEELAAVHPEVRVLHNPARYTPQALNIGLRAARGELIARMDAHTHYPTTYLEVGAARLRRGDVVCVGGPQIAVGEGRWSSRVALALTTPLGVGATARSLGTGETEVETVFLGMWRRAVLVAAGGWDEGWINDQDFELASRLRAAGGRIVCLPEMAADYVARDDLRRLARQYWRYGHYRVKTALRHPSTLHLSHLLPPGLAVSGAAAVAGPRPIRLTARLGLLLYAAVLAVVAGRVARATSRHRDAATLPLVLSTMHLAYGCGAIAGIVRFVPPALLGGGRGRGPSAPPQQGGDPLGSGGDAAGQGAGVRPVAGQRDA